MIIEDYSKGDKICAIHKCGKKAIYKITTRNCSLFYLCEDCYKNGYCRPVYLSDHNSGIPDIKDMDLDEVMRTSYSFGTVTTPNTIRALYKNRHHTCGNCKYDTVPEKDAPCVNCIHSMDTKKDLWTPKGE